MAKSKQHRRGVDMNYIQANSPYNDGWTREFYANEVNGVGKQLELFPDLYPPTHIEEIKKDGLYPWHENEDDGEEDVVQEWPGLDAISKEWV